MSKLWVTSELPRLDLDQLRKQAKELVDEFAAGDPAAVAFVRAHHPHPPAPFQLSDAQWAIARRIGETSWPMLVRRFDELPVIPVRDVVVFPAQRLPLDIGRPRSVAAVAAARAGDGSIVLVAQRHAGVEAPVRADMHDVGTLARVVDFTGTRAIVEGRRRVKIGEVRERDGMLVATTTPLDAADVDARTSALAAIALIAKQEPTAETRALLLPHVHLLPADVQQRVLETDDPATWLAAFQR